MRAPKGEYPHTERLWWMLSHIPLGARVLDIGCGTGRGVTLPLLRAGINVEGIDLDEASIEFGRGLLAEAGLPAASLSVRDLSTLEGRYDVVIMSEVIEHLTDEVRVEMLARLRQHLTTGAKLLVTVPHGHTLFEWEQRAWFATGIGAVLQRSGIAPLLRRLKSLVVTGETRSDVPHTLSSSPHVQWFRVQDIRARLEQSGFDVYDIRGSGLFAGPFSDLLIRGSGHLESWNARLGRRWPDISSGIYLAARWDETVQNRAERVSDASGGLGVRSSSE